MNKERGFQQRESKVRRVREGSGKGVQDELRKTQLGRNMGIPSKWCSLRKKGGTLYAKKGDLPSIEGEKHWKMWWWGGIHWMSDALYIQMREQQRTRRAKAEARTTNSRNVHQWQKQNGSSFKITSILDIASVSKKEELFPKDASEA